MVKCVPLNDQRKLRYPNRKEIDSCFCNLQKEIKELSPQIVFLLGEKVYSAIEKHFGIKFDKWEEFHYSYKKYGACTIYRFIIRRIFMFIKENI